MNFIEEIIQNNYEQDNNDLVIFVDEVPLVTSERPTVMWHFQNEINQCYNKDKKKRNVTLLSAICREGVLL